MTEKFMMGDTVRCVTPPGTDLRKGDLYPVHNVTDGGKFLVIDGVSWYSDRFVLVARAGEKIEENSYLAAKNSEKIDEKVVENTPEIAAEWNQFGICPPSPRFSASLLPPPPVITPLSSCGRADCPVCKVGKFAPNGPAITEYPTVDFNLAVAQSITDEAEPEQPPSLRARFKNWLFPYDYGPDPQGALERARTTGRRIRFVQIAEFSWWERLLILIGGRFEMRSVAYPDQDKDATPIPVPMDTTLNILPPKWM